MMVCDDVVLSFCTSFAGVGDGFCGDLSHNDNCDFACVAIFSGISCVLAFCTRLNRFRCNTCFAVSFCFCMGDANNDFSGVCDNCFGVFAIGEINDGNCVCEPILFGVISMRDGDVTESNMSFSMLMSNTSSLGDF